MRQNSNSKLSKLDPLARLQIYHCKLSARTKMADLSTVELEKFAITMQELASFAMEALEQRRKGALPFTQFKPRGGLKNH